MKTTTATYRIQVTTDEGHLSFLKFMPTKPKTSKGIKSQNNKLSKWVEKQYPNFTSYDISLLDWWLLPKYKCSVWWNNVAAQILSQEKKSFNYSVEFVITCSGKVEWLNQHTNASLKSSESWHLLRNFFALFVMKQSAHFNPALKIRSKNLWQMLYMIEDKIQGNSWKILEIVVGYFKTWNLLLYVLKLHLKNGCGLFLNHHQLLWEMFTLFPHTFLVRWKREIIEFNVKVLEKINDQKHKLNQQSSSPLSKTYDKQEHPRCHKFTKRLGRFLVLTWKVW